MDEVQRLTTSLSEALNTVSEQEHELYKLRKQVASLQEDHDKQASSKLSLQRERDELEAARDAAESELAELSSQLLEDANERVSVANRAAHEAKTHAEELDRRRARQIKEMEDSHQQQIAVLQAMIAAGAPPSENHITAPPIFHSKSLATREVDMSDDDDFAEALEAASWTSPLRPIGRTDLSDYHDFVQLANTAANVAAQAQSDSLLNWSGPPKMPRLSSIKFATRTIAEDVEPTLRLDQAVHISWLVKRAWYTAVINGTLIIEPVNPKLKLWATRPSNPCCLCGEARTSPQYGRLYNIKLPRDNVHYIVGLECVVRVRSACEYIAFLRSLRDGVRKLDSPEAAHAAWSECLRLREQMFWARNSGFYAMDRDAVDRAYVPPVTNVAEADPEDLNAVSDVPPGEAPQSHDENPLLHARPEADNEKTRVPQSPQLSESSLSMESARGSPASE